RDLIVTGVQTCALPILHRLPDESHPDLVGQAVAFAQITAETGRDHVHPARLASARARHHVIDRESLAAPVAVLAGVAVAPEDVRSEERRVGKECGAGRT